MSIEVTSSSAVNTCMSIECEDIKFAFKLSIKNFSQCKQELWSEPFNTGLNCKWMLYIIPNKYGSDGEQHISVYLNLVSSDRSTISAKFKIGIIDITNELKHYRCIDGHQFQVGSDWGWASFVKRSTVFNTDNHLIDTNSNNTLTIVCEIIVRKSIVNSCGEDDEEIMDCSLFKLFSTIFNDKEFTDLKIVVNDTKEFMVHKVVLFSRSEVFADMIRNADEDGQNHLEIQNIQEDIFQELLKFIYTGKTFDKFNDKTEGLFVAALRFDIKPLKRITQEIIYQDLSYETAIHVLMFADENNAIQLKDRVIKYIACNHPYVKRASLEEWEQLIEEQPDLVMEIFDALAVINHH